MREYYREHCYSGIYPSRIMHNMGVSGKISGAMTTVSEIADAVPIIHSPKGCGFHYKYVARRRYLPSYKTQCSNLEEKDIIFGTEKKLKQAISETIDNYNPKMIAIIPSVCTDILDVEMDKFIIDEFRKKRIVKLYLLNQKCFHILISHLPRKIIRKGYYIGKSLKNREE